MVNNDAALAGANRPNSFDLDDDRRAILDQADRFARNELYPLAERMDAEEWWPDDAFPKIGDNGFFGITVPEEYGGAGLDLTAAGLVLQGFSRWNHAMALAWVVFAGWAAWVDFDTGSWAHSGLIVTSVYLTLAGAAQQIMFGRDG